MLPSLRLPKMLLPLRLNLLVAALLSEQLLKAVCFKWSLKWYRLAESFVFFFRW